MEYTEEDLVTKDRVNLKSYIILQTDVGKARKAPTILYFHVINSYYYLAVTR